jgi:hypothetical protein
VTTLSPPAMEPSPSGNDSNINREFDDPAGRFIIRPTTAWANRGASIQRDHDTRFRRAICTQRRTRRLNTRFLCWTALNVVGSVIATMPPQRTHSRLGPHGRPQWLTVGTCSRGYLSQYLSFTELWVFAAVPEPGTLALVCVDSRGCSSGGCPSLAISSIRVTFRHSIF